MNIVEQKLEKIQDFYKKNKINDLKIEHAFSYFIIQYFYNNGESIEDINYKIKDCLTDGANDGGIDFVYFDEDNSQIIVGQSKYTVSLEYEDARVELIKMSNTIRNFKNSDYSSYNSKLQKKLLEVLDSSDSEKIKYYIFTISDFNNTSFIDSNNKFIDLPNEDDYHVYNFTEIAEQVDRASEQPICVSESTLEMDASKNVLKYNNEEAEGVIVNISSESITKLHALYGNKGLYSLNIRNYIKNNNVDNKIQHTLDRDRDNFWFLNNGITIVCDDFNFDGNTIKLYNFSIVNGGQTTNRIGNYKGKNKKKFYIMCKIVKTVKRSKDQIFASKIAEATNSQKPILLRDLRSNSPEMINLKKILKDNGVFLEIKRGEKRITGLTFIRNDELGQIILSFVHQKPGTSRSNKKAIFETDIYDMIFKFRHQEKSENIDFLVDLVKLRDQIREVVKDLIEDQNSKLSIVQLEVIANAEHSIIALFGIVYALKNKLLTKNKLLDNSVSVKEIIFERHSIIRNYQNDDYYIKLKNLIKLFIRILSENYKKLYNSGDVKGVSNYFKSDSTYYETLSFVFDNILSFEDSTSYEVYQESIKIIDEK